MSKQKLFLSAKWENLILVTYDVEPALLSEYIPQGLEADTINGKAFISLVAFDFLDTKVKGIKIPFHVNFPEINLRIYVTNKEKRGVVFIREFVPKAIIPLVANLFYNENYKSISMRSSIEKNSKLLISHSVKYNSKNYTINIEADNKPFLPPVDSFEHFFKEHSWGFGVTRNNQPLMYRVEHPFWNIYPVIKFNHNFDFAEIYGNHWKFLNEKQPFNVTLAEGSPVLVFSGEILK